MDGGGEERRKTSDKRNKERRRRSERRRTTSEQRRSTPTRRMGASAERRRGTSSERRSNRTQPATDGSSESEHGREGRSRRERTADQTGERRNDRRKDYKEKQQEEQGGERVRRGESAAVAAPAITGRDVRILYTNAQSLPGKIDELAAMTNNEKPDLILLTETWCSGHILDNDSLSNFSQYCSLKVYDLHSWAQRKLSLLTL